MNISDAAKAIRDGLTALGLKTRDVSVRKRPSATSESITVTIKRLGIPKDIVEGVALRYQEISRDVKTGEILSGGNTFVRVRYEESALEPLRAEVMKLVEPLAVREHVKVGKYLVLRSEQNNYLVDARDSLPRSAFAPRDVAWLIANDIAALGHVTTLEDR